MLLATSHRKGGLRLTLVNKAGQDLNIAVDDLEEIPVVLGSIQLPGGFAPQRREWRNEVAKRLRQAKIKPKAGGGRRQQPGGRTPPGVHPVELDPAFRAKLRAAGEAERVAREIADIERRVQGKNQSLGHDFDRVLAVLSAYGYVELDDWQLTEAGEMLARTFHECDLLVAEIVRAGSARRSGPRRPGGPRLGGRVRAPEPRAACGTVVLVERHPDRGGAGSRRSARSCEPRNARSGSPSIVRRTRRSRPSHTPGWRGRGSPKW